jgi:uncharacterized protein (DUF885 family)
MQFQRCFFILQGNAARTARLSVLSCQSNMRWLWKISYSCSALFGASLAYVVYTTFWGTPLLFNVLLERQAVTTVLQQPELLTKFGLPGARWINAENDELGGYSLAGRAAQYAQLEQFRSQILSWDRARLSEHEQTSYDLLVWTYDRKLSDKKYPWLGADGQLYPINQAFGIQKSLPGFLLAEHQLTNLQSARSYVARLRAVGSLLDAVNADVARQAKLGVIPPDFVVDASIRQMTALIAPPPARNVLVTNLKEKSLKIGLDETARSHLVGDAIAAMNDIVYPAYRRSIAEQNALRPQAGHEAGVWRLKGGGAYYVDQLRFLTSTDMTPDAIHQYGLSEVARISAQMDSILRSIGIRDGTVGERMNQLRIEPRFLYSNTEDGRRRLLTHYRQLLDHVTTLLPKYFADFPSMELDIARIPTFEEKESVGAYYNFPSLDGSRPGIFFANTRDLSEMPMWAMPTLAYHEGIPGHHLQATFVLENSTLPLLQRLQYYPAYDEGWALYAEQLASDMGLYANDPYGELGRLQSQLFRASRLVVDTGIHAKHWSREYAVRYLQSTTGMANSEVIAEVERDVVWPGQVCVYSIGLKTILDLRGQAMLALGPRFNLKEFHNEILEGGALPLWLLQSNVKRWISRERLVGEIPREAIGRRADLYAHSLQTSGASHN